ncbi:hypothetical protein Tco_0360736 [Tanacetum coccineum]
MQMMYCFVNNIHVDYAELLWEDPTSYLRFTKIIISHYMTSFLEISRRARDMYHNLQDDDIMKNIFNSGRHKDKVGMKIPDWTITEEMKHTEQYRMYAEVFGLDVPLTQSQPTESTQGTHRTLSTPRSPTPKKDTTKSSAPKRSTVIRFHLPKRKSTRLTPPAPVPTVDKADETFLQDTLKVSLVEHKSREEQEARENVELVNKHLVLMEGSENVINDSLPPKNDEPQIPGTRLEPRSDKESPKVEITNDEEVEITNVVIPVNVNEEEEEITDEVYELKRREKGKIVEESKSTPFPTPIRSPRTYTNLVSSDTEKLQEMTETDLHLYHHQFTQTKLSTTNYFFSYSKPNLGRFKTYYKGSLQGEVMVESLLTMVDKHIKEQVAKQVPEHVKVQVPMYVAKGLLLEREQNKEEIDKIIAKAMLQERGRFHAEISSHIQQAIDNHITSLVDESVPQSTSRTSIVRPRDQDDPHDDAPPEGENSAKRQKTSEYEAHVTGESSGQVNESEQNPSSSGNQEQVDDYDFWTESYASDDDEIPTKQDIMEEVSLTINEAELKKIADEMLRQRCTSGDEHQYHIDQMKNFLKSDIVWESRKEILASPHPRKTTPLVQSCQRDPEAPALSLINQDLLYLKKGNSGPEKIVLSLHKFPVIIFNDVDIEERTSRWVNKCVKKFNPYARYGVEHWKNPHAKIFYIKRQKEPGKPKEVVYSNSKIIQCHFTESDYKKSNKIDIEDIYLLIIGIGIGIDMHILCSTIRYEPLRGLKSYNNDVKDGYKQRDLTEDKVEYLKLFEEEIEMALPVQNINYSAFRSMFEREKLSENNFNEWFRQLKLVLRAEKKMFIIEQPLPAAPAADSAANVLVEWNAIYDVYNEVACLILGSMTPELHRQFENSSPYDMIKELKSMFEKQAGVKRFDLIQTFHACKQEEGKPVVAYVLQMKGYVDQLERLGYLLPQDLIVGLILNGLTKDFMGFMRNYNMHNMGKTIGELHAMLIEYEKGLNYKG